MDPFGFFGLLQRARVYGCPARNLIPCVTIRRAESTGEDPIYTCATDEDTNSRPPLRWERSTAPSTRWPRRRPVGAGVSSCGPSARSGRGRKSGGGRAGRSRGRGEPIGGAEIGKRRGPPCANIFLPRPARGLCGRPPTRGSRQVDMHLALFTCHSLARSGAGPGSSV